MKVKSKAPFRWGAAFLVLALVVWLAVELHAPHAKTIGGTVRCDSGDKLEGIWVQGTISASGWAAVQHDPNQASRVGFSYTLGMGGTYEIHVGCGGSISSWTHADYSPTESETSLDFSCVDKPTDPMHGVCLTRS